MRLTEAKLKQLIKESLNEGILQQMEAEKILRDEYFRVRELYRAGKATEEEVSKAYEDMTNLDRDQFYTADELASFEAERTQRDIDDQARMDQEFEDERVAKQRLDQDRIAALKMSSGYKDRGIDMGLDDPGDIDDLYPNLREGSMHELYNVDQVDPDKGTDRLIADAMKEMSEFENESGLFKRPPKELISLVARAIAEAPKSNPKDGMKLVQKAKEIGIEKKVYKVVDKIKSGKLTFPQYESQQRIREGLMYEGDDSILALFEDATLEEGGNACGACLFEQLQEASCGCPHLVGEAEYRGRKVKLNKPMRGDVKKFKVYVKDPKTGNIKKVNFGDKKMRIKKSNPKRRKSFRARHNCKNPGPKTKARYWSCKKW